MKFLLTITGALSIAAASPAFCGTITFDGAPTGVDLGNYYQGVTFGAGDQATTQILPYLPAHSGTEALSGSGTASTITFSFATPQSALSFYYVSYLGFVGTAYSASGSVVGSINGINNYNTTATAGNAATYSQYAMAVLNTGTADISTVVLKATSGSSAFTFVDDLTASGVSGAFAPDAASTLGLLGFASAGLVVLRRKFAMH